MCILIPVISFLEDIPNYVGSWTRIFHQVFCEQMSHEFSVQGIVGCGDFEVVNCCYHKVAPSGSASYVYLRRTEGNLQ